MAVQDDIPRTLNMPKLSQYFTRAALLYLILGFTVGALMLINKGLALDPFFYRLLPAHIEILLVGWTLQLALGVAFWILPRFWQGPPRGNEAGAWASFFFLNTGVVLIVVGTLFSLGSWAFLLGRIAEVGAALAFGSHIWPRIVPRSG